jgi:carbamoyl-phosphate synthase large subunit
MQSTGEVIGIGASARDAIGKALIAANLLPPPPREGQRTVLLSIADRDKVLLSQLAQPLVDAGYDLAATPGTRDALAAIGISASPAAPLGGGGGSGAPEIVELIRSGAVCAVVNTPSPQSGVLRDALEIRLAAVEEGVLCLTTMETAVAAAESLAVRRSLASVAISPLSGEGLR